MALWKKCFASAQRNNWLSNVFGYNDFVHVDFAYLPQRSTATSPSALLSASTSLPPHELPLVRECPMVERTMRPPLAYLAVSPTALPTFNIAVFNVGKYLID